MFVVGSRVRIIGLKSRPELNGTIAVVLQPENDEEVEKLAKNGRIKVTGVPPKSMSIQRANLTPIDERTERTDWTCRTIMNRCSKISSMCIKDIIQNSNLGDCSKCDEFVDRLCEIITDGTSLPRHRFYEQQLKDTVLNHTAKHCIYFCYFDHMGHCLVFETKGGKARLFQSFM